MSKRKVLPDSLSRRQKLRLAGRMGRRKSGWDTGFASPLSIPDTAAWAHRKATGKPKP